MNRTFALLAIFATASFTSAMAQEMADTTEIKAIIAASQVTLCEYPMSQAFTEPLCNGKPWKEALTSATDVSALVAEKRLDLMVSFQFNCKGELGNFTPSDQYYLEDFRDLTAPQARLLEAMTKAAKTLQCTPPANDGTACDWWLTLRRAKMKEGQFMIQ